MLNQNVFQLFARKKVSNSSGYIIHLLHNIIKTTSYVLESTLSMKLYNKVSIINRRL